MVMAERTSSEQSIFLNAAEKRTAAERAAYLDQACAGDVGLRSEVEALLAAHERLPAGEGPETAADVQSPLPTSMPTGTVIGRYKVLEPIGEGGYGTVFMAEQTTPVQRRVALKVVKAGMDTRQVIARFEAERQALALMDHPNIAKVHDAGVTDAGRPYFVMELVKGTPITRYCDEHRLTPRARLELFVQVCQAVQHAHQKGIIHRDIKPTNVLVARYDGRAVPKVIDFGVAKATGQRLTDATMFTGFGDVIGTPQYMSPEQAELNQLDVDTRSDVYSLGVLLYELLTGTTPVEGKRVREAALLEVLRVIREEEPPRPSTRLTSAASAAALPGIAAQRGVEPRSLSGIVRGELDWIVMRALEKDRGRRYETASGFAADVERYLAGEPVQAVPSSSIYRFRKFARRNKGPVAAAAVVLLTLIGGIIGTSYGLFRAEQARKEQAKRAEGERLAKLEAERREKETNVVLNYVEGFIFASAQPEAAIIGLGPQVTLRKALDRALATLDGALPDQPLIEARLRGTLATSFYHLGEKQISADERAKAFALYSRHRGPDHPETIASRFALASSYTYLGRYADAVPILEASLAYYTGKYGADHDLTLTCTQNLANAYSGLKRYPDAVKLSEETLRLRKAKFGPDHREALYTMTNLASQYSSGSQYPERGLPILEEALRLSRARYGTDHPTPMLMSNLAAGYEILKRYPKAVELYEELLPLAKATLGPGHPTTLRYMKDLAEAYRQVGGRNADSIKLLEETLELMKVKLGPDDPRTLECRSALTISYHQARRWADAVKVSEESLALRKVRFGPESAEVQGTLASLAKSYAALGKHDEARRCRDEILSIQRSPRRREPASDSARTQLAQALNNLGWDLVVGADPKTWDRQCALELAKAAVELAPETGNYWDTLGVAQYRSGDWAGAIVSLQKCRQLRKFGWEYNTPFFLAMAHSRLGDELGARRWYVIAVSSMVKNAPKDGFLIRCRREAAALLGITESK
jgi:eukaryotic-like serine/threonine-protein kinase